MIQKSIRAHGVSYLSAVHSCSHTGQQDQKLMQELVESAGKKVSTGMVRRKKEKVQMLKPKGFGFAAAPASSSSGTKS